MNSVHGSTLSKINGVTIYAQCPGCNEHVEFHYTTMKFSIKISSRQGKTN